MAYIDLFINTPYQFRVYGKKQTFGKENFYSGERYIYRVTLDVSTEDLLKEYFNNVIVHIKNSIYYQDYIKYLNNTNTEEITWDILPEPSDGGRKVHVDWGVHRVNEMFIEDNKIHIIPEKFTDYIWFFGPFNQYATYCRATSYSGRDYYMGGYGSKVYTTWTAYGCSETITEDTNGKNKLGSVPMDYICTIINKAENESISYYEALDLLCNSIIDPNIDKPFGPDPIYKPETINELISKLIPDEEYKKSITTTNL